MQGVFFPLSKLRIQSIMYLTYITYTQYVPLHMLCIPMLECIITSLHSFGCTEWTLSAVFFNVRQNEVRVVLQASSLVKCVSPGPFNAHYFESDQMVAKWLNQVTRACLRLTFTRPEMPNRLHVAISLIELL